MIKPVFRPVPLLLAGAFIISFSSALVKISSVAPTVSAFYRTFFGAITLVAACAIKKEFSYKTGKNQFLAIACGFVFALDLWAWHICIKHVGPGLATILGNFQVFILSLAGFFIFKERLGFRFFIAVPLAFCGLFAIIGTDAGKMGENYFSGVGFGLLTAVFYSIFLLLLRQLKSDKKQFSLFYSLMILSVVCAGFLGLKAYASGQSFLIPDLKSLSALLCLGIFVHTFGWVMISNALPEVRASHAGLILLLQPTLSFVWDVIFFDRPTGMVAWAGVVVVLAAIYLGMAQKPSPS